MQGNCSFEVLQFFAESVREAAQATDVHPQSVILFFGVADAQNSIFPQIKTIRNRKRKSRAQQMPGE
jgi:hypothetical protein